MFLFILDLSIELESVAPIIYKINKSLNKKVHICSINFIQNHKNNKIINFLKSEGVSYNDYPIKNLRYFFWKLLVLVIKIFPNNNLNFFRNFFRRLYINHILFDKSEFTKYLIRNNIKSVTLDTSVPDNKKKIIFEACKKLDIKLIGYNTGPEILSFKGKLNSKYFRYFDFYLEQNKLRKIIYDKILKKKVKILGSARYSNEWLKIIDKIYNFRKKKKKRDLIKVGVFLTQDSQNLPRSHPLIEKLSKQKNIEIKFRNKPRDYMPYKYCKFSYDELDTSELIDWSNIIISTQTSAILEAMLKKKIVIFLEHLIPKSYGKWLDNFRNAVFLTKKDNDVINFINSSQLKVRNSLSYRKSVICPNNKGILKDYLNFYKKTV